MLHLRNGKYKTAVVKNGLNVMLKRSKLSSIFALQQPSYSQLLRSPLPSTQNEQIITQTVRAASTIESLKTKEPVGKYASVSLPSEAKVVVCGGGVMGAAVAYHLALAGLGPQTVILEQGR